MSISSDRIPNNIHLGDNRKLQKALESWQPDFLEWWRAMGPEGFQADLIWLRTAVSVDADGWAHFDYVRMPDYRWGIFLADPVPGRKIGFGDHAERGVFDQVPGEFRKELRRIIVTQADTEPASVEQQRLLGKTAPSLYDMRNLFQVNVEEGRHLWAMVHLLHEYFGRDGREEAEDLLARRSGHADSPRILEAFNKPVRDWLAFFCFTMFTDRDGKFQLAALAESGFDPLSRVTRFMLTEEAHHLFVGEKGLGRVLERSAQLSLEARDGDVTQLGGIPFDIIQKYVNEWYSASLDLFGAEDSSNSATYFAAGLKGRYLESSDKYWPDHVALEGAYDLEVPLSGGERLGTQQIPLRRAMNLLLRDSYRDDCERGVRNWNRILEKAGVSARVRLPSQRFNRSVGAFAGMPFDPDGELVSDGEASRRKGDWLPTEADYAYVDSLMVACHEPGVFANWIAPPPKGIKGKPVDYAYVKFARA